MNSILSTNQQQQQPRNFREFAASVSPSYAKQQVEVMLQNGQISPQQFEQAKKITNSLFRK